MIHFPEKDPLYSYKHTLRSRYGETDRMGYVYYGRYFDYFEAARTEMIRHTGTDYRKLEEAGVMLPVSYGQIEYRTPIIYDEEMQIEVLVYKEPMVRLETYYKISTYRNSEPHILGQVNLVFVSEETRKPMRAPQWFLDSLESLKS
ncbi:MAG: acyl-CoA thioesterase [Balneolaceae bacterium]|nr:acyl-CoA thioesterase [Balneolaceae bacterium]MCH8548082.1 acyl-CoA thioesterase [Balneolaceae bacterium]